MKILVLGSGGREHALVWHLKKSGVEIECAPGSDAIRREVECWEFKDFKDLSSKVKSRKINQVIVGPEKFLAEGVADALQAEGIQVFGPNREATQLESSKSWAKDFCIRHKIPTARSTTLTSSSNIQAELKKFNPPYVVKASGLAAGKGVWIGSNLEAATQFANETLKSHSSVVIEEFLVGEEVSYFVMIDGEESLFLGAAQDHKRLLENDLGPNTGGMGAYSPVPILTPTLQKKIEREITTRVQHGLRSDRIHYRGFLFMGLMIVNDEPYLLEFNCRLGDPETQALMMRLQTPILDLMRGLEIRDSLDAKHSPGVSLNVVIAAQGYPDQPKSGFELPGLEHQYKNIQIFHSGTKWNGTHWTASGGRLFSVAALRPTLFDCQNAIYPVIEDFSFLSQVTFRRDIGVKAYRHLFTYGSKEFAHG